MDQCRIRAVAQWLQAVRRRPQKVIPSAKTTANSNHPLVPTLRNYFFNILQDYQQSSGLVPSQDAYELFQQVLDYCEPKQFFRETEGSVERFLLNDVLRWTVIHTSTLSAHQQSSHCVKRDFTLLCSCLLALDESPRRAVWESVLREVVAAHADWHWLAEGLLVMVQHTQGDAAHWIPCPTLDQFAKGAARPRPDPGKEQSLYKGRLRFLKVCLGLTEDGITDSPSSSAIVSQDVISDWVYQATYVEDEGSLPIPEQAAAGAVLKALLELVQKRNLLDADQVDRILFSSWQQGGILFSGDAVAMLVGDNQLCQHFLSHGSQYIGRQLEHLCNTSKQASMEMNLPAKVWAERAWRLLQVCQMSTDSTATNLSASLELVHLSNEERWRTFPKVMYLCCTLLLQQIEKPEARLALILACDRSLELLQTILLWTSGASTQAHLAALPRCRDDRCARFLEIAGCAVLDATRFDELIELTVATIVESLQEGRNDYQLARRGVAVLSQLLERRFPHLSSPKCAKIDPEDINEGDWLWYVTDTEQPRKRELVEIAKVHFDTQTGYYFSVRLTRDGEVHERQTVLDRLHRQEGRRTGNPSPDSLDKEDTLSRSMVAFNLVNNIVKPFLPCSSWETMVAELVNVACCHVGLGGSEILLNELTQVVECIETTCRKQMISLDLTLASDSLWKMSLALGYGLNVPSSDWVFDVLSLDPESFTRCILEVYDDINYIGKVPAFDLAVLAWISTAIAHIYDRSSKKDGQNILDGALSLVSQIVSTLFLIDPKSGFTATDTIITRAADKLFRTFLNLRAPSYNSLEAYIPNYTALAQNALNPLIRRFASSWENQVAMDQFGFPLPFWESVSCLKELVEMSQANETVRKIFTSVMKPSNTELLCGALLAPSKRHIALQLLDYLATSGEPQFEGIPLDDSTSHRLKDWIAAFEEEEAEEVQEDVEIVSRWFPRRLMRELETWGEEVYEETDDATSIGRLLLWLYVLRVVDVVASQGFRYRPAFVSYLNQCGAADAALNLALLNDESVNDQKRKTAPALLDVEVLLKDASLLSLSNVSSLVIFCTVEILPSISRRWWEESCPKVYVADVQSFVEKYVAPEILKRELDRIRDAKSTTFGEMKVTASLASREIKATYVQDDFALSVLIQVPPAFPFRSAQVDCSKTLGVPQERWKRWSLQITLMLNNQGGTLQDALLLWKDNVDKEFDGVEPCPVCYSVLHVKTHKLPTLECKTCSHRFHFDCLTQWFRSSGKSQCVLCQQPWQGTRV